MKKVAIYARFSSDNQREESIDAQIRAINEYCTYNKYTVIKIYTDEAKSATTDDRPQFQQMIKDSSTGMFDMVIVHKLDRFSRDRYDSAFYKRELKKNKVRLISVLENLDDSPESIILESVLEGMAEYYSANLSREVMKGMKETAYQCKHTGGIPPLGFDVDQNKNYVINEYEAQSIRLIFEMYSTGYTYGQILDKLRLKKYKTKTGKEFSKSGITVILKNEKYKGTYIFNKTSQKSNGKRNVQPKSEDEIIRIPNGIPAIVSEEMWDNCNKRIRASNKSIQVSQAAKEVYLLTGKIYCGACGGAMVGNRRFCGRNKSRYVTYECNTRKRNKTCSAKAINKDLIEDLVIDYMEKNLFASDKVNQIINKIFTYIDKVNTSNTEALIPLKRELTSTQKAIDNIINAIASGMFHESMKEKMDTLEAKKNELISLIAQTESQSNRIDMPNVELVKNYFLSQANMKNKPLEQQKNIAQRFIKKVIVYPNEVEIHLIVDTYNGGEPITFTSTIMLPKFYRHI